MAVRIIFRAAWDTPLRHLVGDVDHTLVKIEEGPLQEQPLGSTNPEEPLKQTEPHGPGGCGLLALVATGPQGALFEPEQHGVVFSEPRCHRARWPRALEAEAAETRNVVPAVRLVGPLPGELQWLDHLDHRGPGSSTAVQPGLGRGQPRAVVFEERTGEDADTDISAATLLRKPQREVQSLPIPDQGARREFVGLDGQILREDLAEASLVARPARGPVPPEGRFGFDLPPELPGGRSARAGPPVLDASEVAPADSDVSAFLRDPGHSCTSSAHLMTSSTGCQRWVRVPKTCLGTVIPATMLCATQCASVRRLIDIRSQSSPVVSSRRPGFGGWSGHDVVKAAPYLVL